jgi:hypothetical protein
MHGCLQKHDSMGASSLEPHLCRRQLLQQDLQRGLQAGGTWAPEQAA